MAFCLPKKYSRIFLQALKNKELDPWELKNLSSADRREKFSEYFGNDMAKEVNALFESKLLLKDQQRGMISWAKQLSNTRPEVKNDIISRIQKMDEVLNPEDQDAFLADLAEQRLGVSVTYSQAQRITELTDSVADIENSIKTEGWSKEQGNRLGKSRIDLYNYINSLKPSAQTWGERFLQVFNTPKQMETGYFHFTAPFVQNWGLMSNQEWAQAWPKMISYFADQENYNNLLADIEGDPWRVHARRAGLSITDLETTMSRDEAIPSRIFEDLNQKVTDVTGIPNVLKASSRGFTGFNTYTRFYLFKRMALAAKMAGEDVSVGSKSLSDIAEIINDFSGRGKIPFEEKYSGSLGKALNLTFFAPKMIAGKIRMIISPWKLLSSKTSMQAKQMIIRNLVGSTIITGAILELAKANGYKVDMNPVSQDFLEIETPAGTKLNVTSGLSLYVRLVARLYENEKITSNDKEMIYGQGFNAPTRAGEIMNFFRGKLSPVVATLTDAAMGQDAIGREFSMPQEIQDRMTPITVNYAINYFLEHPEDSADLLPALTSLTGIGMRLPLPVSSARRLSVWGEKFQDPTGAGFPLYPPPKNEIDREGLKIGWRPQVPYPVVKGRPLSDKEYREYILYSGYHTKLELQQLINSPSWGRLTDDNKFKLMKQAHDRWKRIASEYLAIKGMTNNVNTPDILEQVLHKEGIQ